MVLSGEGCENSHHLGKKSLLLLHGGNSETGNLGWEGKTRGGETSQKAIRIIQARDDVDLRMQF